MKRTGITILLAVITLAISAYTLPSGKLVSSKTHIRFFSTTAVEDIEANNYASVSTIDPATGAVVFSVPMQSFEFEKALMQQHFNNDKFLDTKVHPNAKLIGRITNTDQINFSKDGTYNANIEGDLTIKGKTNSIKEKGSITVKGNVITVESKFNITLADYGVTFVKGKPASNIAKVVEVTVIAEYKSE